MFDFHGTGTAGASDPLQLWTMPIEPSPSILLEGVALSVLAAVLAGLYPAWRMATALPAEALRDE